jgi:sec-independent protein translocase protein TatA
MISTPGPLELLLILGLALLVLGPTRLPDAARSAGKAVRDFRDALSGDREHEDEDEFSPEHDFASDDEDEAIEAGPAAEGEYREHVAGDDDAPSVDGGERKSGSGTEAGDPAPPPVS